MALSNQIWVLYQDSILVFETVIEELNRPDREEKEREKRAQWWRQ
jgi:hypothetical protein